MLLFIAVLGLVLRCAAALVLVVYLRGPSASYIFRQNMKQPFVRYCRRTMEELRRPISLMKNIAIFFCWRVRGLLTMRIHEPIANNHERVQSESVL